uniref:MltA domain-containing protein n=1 Tax=Derxia lacustris TaxID=764842 RepID=UPI001593116C
MRLRIVAVARLLDAPGGPRHVARDASAQPATGGATPRVADNPRNVGDSRRPGAAAHSHGDAAMRAGAWRQMAPALTAGALAVLLAGCASTPVGAPPEGLPTVPPPASEPGAAPEATPAPGTPAKPAKPAPPPAATPAPIRPAAPNSLVTPALVPARFADLPGWDDDDPREAWPALLRSCGALRSRAEWSVACADAARVDASDKPAVRKYFADHFTPWRVRNADASTAGLATGYYEPLLTASRSRAGRFTVPLYAPPDDLIGIDLGDSQPDLKDTLKGLRLRGRLSSMADGRKLLIPYWTRAELMTGAGASSLAGKALVWVEDPIEAFFLQ